MDMRLVLALAALLAGCAATNQCTIPLQVVSQRLMDARGELFHTGCDMPYHWDESEFPIEVRVAQELPEAYSTRVEEAVAVWNGLVAQEFLVMDAYPWSEDDPREDGAIHVVMEARGINLELGTRTYGDATTPVRFATGLIERAIIRLDVNLPEDLLLTIIVHEIGHSMGLKHDVGDPTSTMFPLTWEARIQRVTANDILAVRAQVPESIPAFPLYVEPESILTWGRTPKSVNLLVCR